MNMQETLRELMKDDYSEIAQRIKKTMQEKGYINKALPFGYDFVNGVPTVNKEEGKIVKWIFERYLLYLEQTPVEVLKFAIGTAADDLLEGMSYEEAESLVNDDLIKEYIAYELSLKELYYYVLSEKGNAICLDDILTLQIEEMPKEELSLLMDNISEKIQEYSHWIKGIVSNDFYSGAIKFRKGHTSQREKRSFDDEAIIVKDHHEAIISPEIFRAAQEANKRNQK